MAGLGAGIAAQRNGVQSCILEASDSVGGLCQSSTVGSCIFDYGPKLLLLDGSINSKEVLAFLEGNYNKYHLQEKLFLSEYGLLDFPIQRNLIDLPQTERKQALRDVRTSWASNKPINNYRDWLTNRYGTFLCKKILFPYEQKKWQTPLEELDYAWAQRRSINEDLNEIFVGARTKLLPGKSYYYPAIGSITNLSEGMAKHAGLIKLERRVNSIDLLNRAVNTGTEEFRYDILISTLPLQSVVMMTQGIPCDLLEETYSSLRTLPIRLYNLVFDGPSKSDSTVIYFPEHRFVFRRVSIVGNLCRSLSHPDKTLLSVEISLPHSVNSVEYGEQLDAILYGLKQVPDFASIGRLIDYQILNLEHAYPIQAKRTRPLVAKLHRFYSQYNVFHSGRGGRFDYCNSDKAYLHGKELVDELFNVGTSPS